jgi:hypothetical protein
LVRLHAAVASGDLHRFRTNLQAHLEGVGLELPQSHVAVTGVDGDVPLVEDLLLGDGATRLLPAKDEPSAYPQLRFADQHALLSNRGALRIQRLAVGDIVFDDVATSLGVHRDQIALDALEARVQGGRIAGQSLVTVRGPDSKVQLRLRATGIEAGARGARDRFDGNAALTLGVRRRSLDGRIEIVRIGRQNLRTLLDEADPARADPGINRIRTALTFGYPDRVSLVFAGGFARLHVGLGGLAGIMSLSDVEGIPLGPLAERYLGPTLSGEASP